MPTRFWPLARPNWDGVANASPSRTGMFSGMISASIWPSWLISDWLNTLESCDNGFCCGVPLKLGVCPRSGSNQTMM
ncbi:hypothetical protein D3C71_1794200 [compost metagenome]